MTKKRFFSRKGVAVEYAIMIMVVVMGLSTIILTNSMLQASYRSKIEKKFFAQVDVDSIGTSFVYDCTNSTYPEWQKTAQETYVDYTIEVSTHSDNAYRVLNVYRGTGDNRVLILCVEVKQFSYLSPTIVKWESYTE